MKISSAVIVGLLFGAAIGLVSLGKVNVVSPDIELNLHNYAWWIVVGSMLVPMADYLSGVRTTLTGVATSHPYRHFAGFFTGWAVGLALLLLLSARLPT